MKKYIFFIILIFILSVVFCGCGELSRVEDGNHVGGAVIDEITIENNASSGDFEAKLPLETDIASEDVYTDEEGDIQISDENTQNGNVDVENGVLNENNENSEGNSSIDDVQNVENDDEIEQEEGGNNEEITSKVEETQPKVPTDIEEEIAEKAEKALYIRAKVDGLNVRTGAGTAYKSLGFLDKGDMVAYLGEENGWYATYYMGRKAYISANYAEPYEMEKGSDRVESVISHGCELLGTKYVYGAVRLHDGYGRMCKGFTSDEFDCSSLMQYIFYYGAGECLQVNTRTQVYQGEEIAKNEIKRGDLLFFTNASRRNKTGIERIGHVALYLGDGYILHTASDHAVIEKITPTRDSYFICARRIIE